jgi:hypothetical protein
VAFGGEEIAARTVATTAKIDAKTAVASADQSGVRAESLALEAVA